MQRAALGSRRNTGYIALALIALVSTLGVTWLVTSMGANAVRNERERKTTAVLAQAKQALIGRAAIDASLPGSLPCPDMITQMTGNVPDDGIADLFAGNNCPSYIGRLPWRTLGLADLRDADGERLWYALSPTVRDYASLVVINDATTGAISVTGATAINNVVAVVFAPGAALGNQLRDTPSNRSHVANYLEGANATGATAFVSHAPDATFNDRLVAITVADMMAFVEKRVATEVTLRLNQYFSGASLLPNPAAVNDFSCQPHGDPNLCLPAATPTPGFVPRNITAGAGWPGTSFPAWFNSNWRTSIGYTVAPECTSLPPCLGTTFSAVTDIGVTPPKVTLVIGTIRRFTIRVFGP